MQVGDNKLEEVSQVTIGKGKVKQSSLGRILKKNSRKTKESKKHSNISNSIYDGKINICNRNYWLRYKGKDAKKIVGASPKYGCFLHG